MTDIFASSVPPRTPVRETLSAAVLNILRRPEITAALVLLALGVFLADANPHFTSERNLTQVARAMSFVSIAGLGGLIVLSSGQLDLSIGSCMGLAGVLGAYLSYNLHVSDWMVVLVAIAIGAVFGLVNGALIVLLALDPLIVTLGTSLVGRGAIFVLTNGWPVGGISPGLRELGYGFTAGLPNPVWIALALAAVFAIVMRRTSFGWHIYAIGNNEEAARVSGVRVERLKLVAFVIGGVTAALGGFLLTARMGTGEVSLATGYELDVIAAATIGGLRFGIGSKGVSVLGMILGMAVIAVLRNALSLLSVPPEYQQIVLGGALLFAMGLERLRSVTGA